MTTLLVTWLPKKRTILSAINTSGPTCTNKWTRTVLPTWFIKEQEWSVGSNQGSFSLFLSPRRHEMFSLRTFLLGYQKKSHMRVRTTQSLWLSTNFPKCFTTLTLPLGHDSRRISRSHHARSHMIAWSTFSNYIWSWIAFHLPVLGKPHVILPNWATT